MIERVTDEVIAEMRRRGEIPASSGSATKPLPPAAASPVSSAWAWTCVPRVLVVLAGAGDGASLENGLAQLGRIGDSGLSVACLVSDETRGTCGEDTVTRILGPVSFVGEHDAIVSAACADIVVIPVLPLHVAARVALLTGGDVITRAVVAALLGGRRVYAAADSILPTAAGHVDGVTWAGSGDSAGVSASVPARSGAIRESAAQSRHNFAVCRQVDEYLKRLREYGVILVGAKDLGREVERGLRVIGFGPAGSVPGFPGMHGAHGVETPTPRRTEAGSVAFAAAANASPRAGVDAGTRSAAGAVSTNSTCSRLSGECSACGRCVEENPGGTASIVEAGASRVGAAPGIGAVSSDLAAMIDHTLLKPDATRDQVIKLCEEAKQYRFASVCVNPANVSLAAGLLKGTPVKVCTVIGFPLGATTPTAKAMETRDAIANGATEVDMVINVGALKSGDYDLVKRDIEAVAEAARGRALVKVILETALLTDEEKVKACLLAKLAGADFVKTSTGFGPGGATVEDVRLMRKVVGADMGVKAAGGIRTLETARKMVEAGASRIGASASVAIVKGQ